MLLYVSCFMYCAAGVEGIGTQFLTISSLGTDYENNAFQKMCFDRETKAWRESEGKDCL